MYLRFMTIHLTCRLLVRKHVICRYSAVMHFFGITILNCHAIHRPSRWLFATRLNSYLGPASREFRSLKSRIWWEAFCFVKPILTFRSCLLCIRKGLEHGNTVKYMEINVKKLLNT
jgi:hypothetical protein